jgi:triosephosphate isomerase (TIM)
MRRPLIAGNWKMNLNRREAIELASSVSSAEIANGVDVVVCPPFVWLQSVIEAVDSSAIGVGAQDVYFEENGAFTGETSAEMLVDLGCRYVIIGHSERRHILGETDETVNKKVLRALQAGLIPIVCVGETLAQREAGNTSKVVQTQFHGSLQDVSAEQISRVIIAYEPVWAIGTGKTATTQQAEEVHADLRKLIKDRYNSGSADQVRILYGGSVKPGNSAELLTQPNIDGALVGGASLKSDDFLAIINSATAHAGAN